MSELLLPWTRRKFLGYVAQKAVDQTLHPPDIKDLLLPEFYFRGIEGPSYGVVGAGYSYLSPGLPVPQEVDPEAEQIVLDNTAQRATAHYILECSGRYFVNVTFDQGQKDDVVMPSRPLWAVADPLFDKDFHAVIQAGRSRYNPVKLHCINDRTVRDLQEFPEQNEQELLEYLQAKDLQTPIDIPGRFGPVPRFFMPCLPTLTMFDEHVYSYSGLEMSHMPVYVPRRINLNTTRADLANDASTLAHIPIDSRTMYVSGWPMIFKTEDLIQTQKPFDPVKWFMGMPQ